MITGASPPAAARGPLRTKTGGNVGVGTEPGAQSHTNAGYTVLVLRPGWVLTVLRAFIVFTKTGLLS